MKTKITILSLILFGFTSCIKDYVGSGSEKIELTEENYLSYDSLFVFFAPQEIENINAQIKGSDDEEEIIALQQRKAYIENQVKLSKDVSQAYGLPVPCVNLPNGKCVPVRLEFFPVPNRFKDVLVIVQDLNGNVIGAANELSPMPGLEEELNVLQIPVIDSQKQLKVTFRTTDIEGFENTISGVIGE